MSSGFSIKQKKISFGQWQETKTIKISFIFVQFFSMCNQEMDQKCQTVINDSLQWCEDVAGHNSRFPCLFGNALDLIPYKTYDISWTYSRKLSAVKQTHIATTGQCLRHCALCPVFKPMAQFGVSGLPCPDMSSAGLRRKRAGPTSTVYMAHGRYVSVHKIPLLLVECTKELWPLISYIYSMEMYFDLGCFAFILSLLLCLIVGEIHDENARSESSVHSLICFHECSIDLFPVQGKQVYLLLVHVFAFAIKYYCFCSVLPRPMTTTSLRIWIWVCSRILILTMISTNASVSLQTSGFLD